MIQLQVHGRIEPREVVVWGQLVWIPRLLEWTPNIPTKYRVGRVPLQSYLRMQGGVRIKPALLTLDTIHRRGVKKDNASKVMESTPGAVVYSLFSGLPWDLGHPGQSPEQFGMQVKRKFAWLRTSKLHLRGTQQCLPSLNQSHFLAWQFIVVQYCCDFPYYYY